MKYDTEWYNNLSKPDFMPPAWIFAPVWSILYILMFISFVIVLVDEFELENALAYLLFCLQFAVNLYWPITFFKEHNLRKAFLTSVALAILVFFTMLIFFEISKLAGILFLPYFLWCLFASLLSFQILELNEW